LDAAATQHEPRAGKGLILIEREIHRVQVGCREPPRWELQQELFLLKMTRYCEWIVTFAALFTAFTVLAFAFWGH